MNERLQTQLAALRTSFARLTPREQWLVLGISGGLMLLLLVGTGYWVASATSRAERRVKVKTDQLAQVMQLQGEYRQRQAERASKIRDIESSNVRLVSLIEETARQASVDIGQLRPEDGQPSEDGIIESRVDLKASGLSADKLQEFLSRIELSPGPVLVRRVKLNRPFNRDVVDLEATIVTFKMKK